MSLSIESDGVLALKILREAFLHEHFCVIYFLSWVTDTDIWWPFEAFLEYGDD